MYYPIQIPFILHKDFSKNMRYTETVIDAVSNFVICFWEMQPLKSAPKSVENIIVTDGCIDLVAGYDEKRLGFVGMDHTVFDYTIELPSRSFGARMMPGAFFQLTGIPANQAMNSFVPIEKTNFEFNQNLFFSLPYDEAKNYFKQSFVDAAVKKPDRFTSLFSELCAEPPASAAELYEYLNLEPRTCQRLFEKHFGLSPKLALSILRFQRCLEVLTSGKASPGDVLDTMRYYDQSHFINDFKRNLGITPMELISRYRG